MPQNKIQPAIVLGAQPSPAVRRLRSGVTASATWSARLSARVFAGRCDRRLEACVPVVPGSALAVHCARLTASRERQKLARALRSMLTEAREPGGGRITVRIPLHRTGISAVEDLLDEVASRLCAPLPVRARGIARLRLLLADGAGPLYRPGRGSLTAALRGVLAAL